MLFVSISSLPNNPFLEEGIVNVSQFTAVDLANVDRWDNEKKRFSFLFLVLPLHGT